MQNNQIQYCLIKLKQNCLEKLLWACINEKSAQELINLNRHIFCIYDSEFEAGEPWYSLNERHNKIKGWSIPHTAVETVTFIPNSPKIIEEIFA